MRYPLLRWALVSLLFGCSNQSSSAPVAPANGSPDAGTPDATVTPAADAGGHGDASAPPSADSGATAPSGGADAASDRTSVDAGGGGNPADGGAPASDAAGGGGSTGASGDGGFTLPITDAGCSTANPPTGSLNLTIDGGPANYIVTLPTGYRANTAVPLVFGFHGRNRTNEQFEDVDALDIKTEIAPFAIMVYPQSQGGPGWEMTNELPLNIEFFEELWTQFFSNYCIDPNRVFVMGHSSGAIFSNILACRYGDRLRGVGAVASTLPETTCVGNVAAMLVHGGQDPIIPVEAGMAARDFYIQRNGCQMTSMPGEVAPCIAYEGCRTGLPVEWCEHTEPTYTMTDGGGHGYPTFASKAIWDFFSPLMPKTP